jgi:tetratricopeptide (TPR) repeat protein
MTQTDLLGAKLARLGPGATPSDEDRPESHLARGLVLLYRDQQFERAREAFERARAAARDPSLSGEASFEEGRALELLGRAPEAAELYARAEELFPETSGRRAACAYRLARLEAARGELEAARVHHPRSRAYYDVGGEGGELRSADFWGFEAWLAERTRDARGWVGAVRGLARADQDQLSPRRVAARGAMAGGRARRLLRGVRAFRRELDADPASARADVAWARALEGLLQLALGKPRRALRAALRALGAAETLEQDEPVRVLATHVAGRALARRGRRRAAIAVLERAAQPTVDLLLDLAILHERTGDLERANGAYERIVARDPGRALVLARLARTSELLDRKDRALWAYLAAARAQDDPREQGSLAGRIGLLLADLGRDREARRWLDRALRARPGSPGLLVARGRVLARQGRLARAYPDLVRAVEALETGHRDLTQAGPLAGDALDLERLLAEARLRRGEVLLRLGRPAEAMLDLDRCLEIAPDRDEAHMLQGDCARALGRPSEAIEHYKSAVDKKLGEALLEEGIALHRAGRHAEALSKYRRAFEKMPQSFQVYYRTAQAYAALGERAPALKYLEIACRINQNVRMLLEKDPPFAPLKGTVEFREIFGEPPAQDRGE